MTRESLLLREVLFERNDGATLGAEPMMWIGHLLACTSPEEVHLSPPPIAPAPVPFTITTGVGPFEIERHVLPEPGTLPSGVHTERLPSVLLRVPPRLRSGDALSGGTCALSVTVSDRGRPSAITLLDEPRCPEEMRKAAIAAIKRWRWTPAERDGVSVSSQTIAAVRFQP